MPETVASRPIHNPCLGDQWCHLMHRQRRNRVRWLGRQQRCRFEQRGTASVRSTRPAATRTRSPARAQAAPARPSSVTVNVNSAPAAATISSLTATPGALQTGGSTLLAWTSANADACAATGGSGSGWSGLVATSSTGISVGPINTAGSYIYTITCTGPGGTSAPSSATVIVTATAPPASITSFTAAPSTLITGQSAVLGLDDERGQRVYRERRYGFRRLARHRRHSERRHHGRSDQCHGQLHLHPRLLRTRRCQPAQLAQRRRQQCASGGEHRILHSHAPARLPAGQSTTLAWSSSNATSCAATGGSGSDGWGRNRRRSSAGTSVGPLTTAGPLTYTLTCTGPGGAGAPSAANVTVTAVVPAAPTVALAINGANVAEIQPGQSPRLTWTSSHATSCTASGGTGSDGWSGAQPTTSSGAAVGSHCHARHLFVHAHVHRSRRPAAASTVQLTVISLFQRGLRVLAGRPATPAAGAGRIPHPAQSTGSVSSAAA